MIIKYEKIVHILLFRVKVNCVYASGKAHGICGPSDLLYIFRFRESKEFYFIFFLRQISFTFVSDQTRFITEHIIPVP